MVAYRKTKNMRRGIYTDLKRPIAAIIAMLLLIFMATASASSAGTTSDPLISQSYLSGTFTASLNADISRIFSGATDDAIAKLERIFSIYAEYSFAARFTDVSLMAGDTVMLSMGSSFILLSGSAAITSINGTVINISEGQEVATGSLLTENQRYFCAEDTIAVITANSTISGQVDGFYIIETAAINRPHPVFRDVREKDWYYPAVDFVYNRGLFGGTAPNAFSPATSMTRGMFVTVLYRLEQEPEVGPGGQFYDVSDTSSYYYNAVTWASENNIVLGYSDNMFSPNDPVTREQMATIIYRYATYKQRDMSSSDYGYNAFPDIGDVSDYAADAMRWAVSWGVINGSGGKLLPRNTATRAEVAQIISNYIEKIR